MDILVNLKKAILVRWRCWLGLSEELGELAREINHYYGEKPKKARKKKIPLKMN